MNPVSEEETWKRAKFELNQLLKSIKRDTTAILAELERENPQRG